MQRTWRVMAGLLLAILVVGGSARADDSVHVYVIHRPAPRPQRPHPPTVAGAKGPRYQIYYGDATYLAAYRRVIHSYNPGLSDAQLDTIVRSILYYSYRFKVDPRFVVAVVACESAFRPQAVSSAGAGGLGQLMPGTAQGMGVDPMVPYQNIQGTVRYLALNLTRFRGLGRKNQMRMTLAAYNAGYGAVQKYGGIPPYPETQNYVRVVMTEWTRLSGER